MLQTLSLGCYVSLRTGVFLPCHEASDAPVSTPEALESIYNATRTVRTEDGRGVQWLGRWVADTVIPLPGTCTLSIIVK